MAHEGEGEPVGRDSSTTTRITRRLHAFDDDTSRDVELPQAGLWVAQEPISYDDRQSLEGVGLVRVELAGKQAGHRCSGYGPRS